MSKRMAQDVSDLLAECLSAAETDGAGLDRCLAQHPQHEPELRDLAALASELRRMPSPPPTEAFRASGYRSLMTEIRRKPVRGWPLGRLLQSSVAGLVGRGRRPAPVWAGVLVVVLLSAFLGTAGVVLAAESALPGDPLYGLKTTTEGVRLAVTPAEGEVSLHARYAGRRLGEIEALVAANRLVDVSQAVAGYQAHVGQAVKGLTAAGNEDAATQARLISQLDRMLSEQAAELDALAHEAPAQVAPLIRRAQTTSAGAQDAIKQIRAGSGAEPTDKTIPTPTATPAAAPGSGNPPGAAGTASPTPTSTSTATLAPAATSTPSEAPPLKTPRTAPPGAAPIGPLPGATPPPPGDDRGGEPGHPPGQSTPATPPVPVTPPANPMPTRVGMPPAERTPMPPAETRTPGTAAPPPSGEPPPGSTPAPPPAPPGGSPGATPPPAPPTPLAGAPANSDAGSPAPRATPVETAASP